MSKNRWKYTCPICKNKVEEKYTQPYIKKGWIGATHNCPCCGGLLIINKDLTCSDFEDEWPSVDYLVKYDEPVWGLIKQDVNENINLIHDYETRNYKL